VNGERLTVGSEELTWLESLSSLLGRSHLNSRGTGSMLRALHSIGAC
jgi:hypothetical protein